MFPLRIAVRRKGLKGAYGMTQEEMLLEIENLRCRVAELEASRQELNRTEQALRESEQKYETLLDSLNTGVFLSRLDGLFLHANPMIAQMAGYSSVEEFKTVPAHSLYADPSDRDRLLETLRENGSVRNLELLSTRKDGTAYWISLNAVLNRDENGQPNSIFGIVEDISDRKRYSQALAASEAKYRSLFENNPASLWEEDFSQVKAYVDRLKESGVDDFRQYFAVNPEEVWRSGALVKILDVNQASLDLYRADNKSGLIERLGNVLCQESFDALSKQVVAIAEGETEFQTESVNRNLHGDPLKIILKWSVAPGHDQDYSRVLVSILDITERQNAVDALRKSQQKLQAIFEASPAAIFLLDPEGRITFANRKMRELFSRPWEELLGSSYGGLVHPEQRSIGYDKLKSLMAEEFEHVSLDQRYLASDSRLFLGHLSGRRLLRPDGSLDGLLGIIEDVTDRRQAQETLKDSEEKYRNLVELSPDGVFVQVGDQCVFANPALAKIAGVQSPDQLIGKPVMEFVHPDFIGVIEQRVKELMEERKPVPPLEQKMIRPDGTPVDIEVTAAPLTYHGQEAYQAIVRDIGERKRMESALLQTEEKYRTLVERSNLGIFISSMDGFLIHANPRMAEMAGYDDVQDVIGVRAERLYTNVSDRKRLLENLQEKGSVEGFEVCAARKDGTPHWVSLSAVLQRDEAGSYTRILGIAEDITERKTARDKIKAALEEKEALLREIHHRVKNNLAVVSSLLGFQSRHAKDEHHRRMFIDSQDRIRSMALAHEKLYQAENLSAINSKDYLTSLVHHLLTALGHVGSDVRLQLQLCDADLDLETGVTLGLIVTELVSNCFKHAFPDHRTGKISLALRDIGDPTLELSVADDGIGLPLDVQLDNPSTLGLDLVRIFARQLRGNLEVRRDIGTEIILRFSRMP